MKSLKRSWRMQLQPNLGCPDSGGGKPREDGCDDGHRDFRSG